MVWCRSAKHASGSLDNPTGWMLQQELEALMRARLTLPLLSFLLGAGVCFSAPAFAQDQDAEAPCGRDENGYPLQCATPDASANLESACLTTGRVENCVPYHQNSCLVRWIPAGLPALFPGPELLRRRSEYLQLLCVAPAREYGLRARSRSKRLRLSGAAGILIRRSTILIAGGSGVIAA